MRGSLVISAGLHALILGFAMSSFSAPRTLEVTDVEALPIDIVPIEEITQIQQGEKTEPLAEIAAPKPTKRPEPVADAENVGDNTVDLSAQKTDQAAEREVVAEAPPKAAETPVPSNVPDVEPEPKPEPVQAAKPEPAPVEPEPAETAESEPAPPEPEPVEAAEPAPASEPAPQETEVAALPPEPDPVAEAIENTPAEPEFEALPQAGPVPSAKPKPETPKKTETAPAEKKPEPQKQVETASASSKKSDFNADEIAALLNKEEAKGGGAKRSTETASLGGSQTTRGNTLTQSEMDALRGQIQKYWNIIPGMADGGDVRVTVKMRLDQSGNIVGNPEVSASGGSPGTQQTLAGSARRAVLRAQPYTLPAEKYASWSEVIVHFDPSQMF